ncbi:MAG: FAD-binding and (Fe-S)-binding domain-containing protein [Bacteroidota bacterium]
MLPKNYQILHKRLLEKFDIKNLIQDELRLLAYGTDASFYRLIPKLVVLINSAEEVKHLLHHANHLSIPVTFRAAGTSLSGQSISDSVLAVLVHGFKNSRVDDNGKIIQLEPGVIGSHANRILKSYNRKIGPDPASINSAMIGGIAANNASGMCCGTAQNSYNTLAGMKIIFADGTTLDTRDIKSIDNFKLEKADFCSELLQMSQTVNSNSELAARIRHKYKMKNTTGYSLNSLVDFDDVIEIIQHLMIGSEGTLGFISEISYNTVVENPFKASALMIFTDIGEACEAVSKLKSFPVDAVEIMDRAALRSVQDKPGMPQYLKELDKTSAALLVETSACDENALGQNIVKIAGVVKDSRPEREFEFLKDKSEYEKLWKIRKGLFPSVGAMRNTGTTVIIEDVCFPLNKLASATLELQGLFKKYNYTEAIIFGHALEGNLHFVFNQDFNSHDEVIRYKNLMNDVVELVVQKYDGALKAEHGTGRNMAPFVKYEWGEQAYDLMIQIKMLFDPKNILNPGVIINPDQEIHLKNLKPLPAANSIIDKCIECGFCEINCPSKDLTLTPRQRIAVWREISRLKTEGKYSDRLQIMLKQFDYYGEKTCATDGLCATTCPVDIDTGKLIKELRSDKISNSNLHIANFIASNFSFVLSVIRSALRIVHFFHRILGSTFMQQASLLLRKVSLSAMPLWNKYLPNSARSPRKSNSKNAELSVVYFPSCISRTMGLPKGSSQMYNQTEAMLRLLEKGGYRVIYPINMNYLCCGMPFSSKGFFNQADQMAEKLRIELEAASKNGEYPILFDTSPCVKTFKDFLAKNGNSNLHVFDSVEFIHDLLIDKLTINQTHETIAIHPTCSVTKLGLTNKLIKVAEKCSTNVVIPEDVNCCGFAGDRGFSYPELNESALHNLKSEIEKHNCTSGYSTSKTCEIGLSLYSGIEYRSIAYLVDKCTDTVAMIVE